MIKEHPISVLSLDEINHCSIDYESLMVMAIANQRTTQHFFKVRHKYFYS